MSVTKRISTGDYNLTTNVAAKSNVVITTDTFKIIGNLYVQGNTSIVNVANISTADPTITLNSNVTTPFAGNSGIEINRGPGNYTTGLFWNETSGTWQITSNIADPTAYEDIATSLSGSGTVNSGTSARLAYYAATGTAVSGTSANLTWTNSTSILRIIGNLRTSGLQLANVSGTPATVTGNITISGNTTGGSAGGTGIYFNNGTESGELVSKSKAVVYGIIFS